MGSAIAFYGPLSKNVYGLVLGFPFNSVSVIGDSKTTVLKKAGQVKLCGFIFDDATTNDAAICDGLSVLGEGSAAGEQFGAALTMADVNSDGISDLVVGSPFATVVAEGGLRLKAAGKVSFLRDVRDPYAGSVYAPRFGGQAGEQFGAALSHDAIEEVVYIGSPGYDARVEVAGKTSVLKDAGRAQAFSLADNTSAPLVEIQGEVKGMRLGAAVSAAGMDVNADGHPDWSVGVPGAGVQSLVNDKSITLKAAGEVRLYSGLNNARWQVFHGQQVKESLGSSIFMSGDINNDGINDLVMGLPKNDQSTLVNSKTKVVKDAGKVDVVNIVLPD